MAQPVVLDTLFLPLLGGTTVVFLVAECVTLSLGVLDIAIASRIVMLVLLFVIYRVKSEVTRLHLSNTGKRRLLYRHNYVILSICALSAILHFVLLWYIAHRFYSVLFCLLSGLVASDEYSEIQWLQEQQKVRRNQHRNVSDGRHVTITVVDAEFYEDGVESETDESVVQMTTSTTLPVRITVYQMLFTGFRSALDRARVSLLAQHQKGNSV